MSSSEALPSTLTTVILDVQLKICSCLHPSDIFSLRKTCKTLKLVTKERIVWIEALHRVCRDNALFLPSFPTVDMSDDELEQAAMAPRRWIRVCATLGKKHPPTELQPTATRIIQDPLDGSDRSMERIETFIVPGGRYLVSKSLRGIGVWDLGYTSSAHCKLLASVGWDGGSYLCRTNVTSDGMGLIVVAISRHDCFVYEIYPQSETPQLTQIAHIPCPRDHARVHALPNKVVWYERHGDRMIFRVWDYRLNHSINFAADFEIEKLTYGIQPIATETAIIILCTDAISVWAIPPLSPQAPDFFEDNPPCISSLFRLPFPHDFLRTTDLKQWRTLPGWYSGSSQPLCFDALCTDRSLHGFEIVIEPDFSHVSLFLTNTSQLLDLDFSNFLHGRNMICDNNLLSITDAPESQYTIYLRMPSRSSNITSRERWEMSNVLPYVPWSTRKTSSICPASGRFVGADTKNHRIVVVDFL